MKNDINIREIKDYDESEINRVISLHNQINIDKRTKENWFWEYKGIYPEQYIFVLAENERDIIGTQGMIPIYINIGGKRTLSGKSENSLLLKKYMFMNLFSRLYDTAIMTSKRKEMCCIWGFTTASHVWKNKLDFSIYEDCLFESLIFLNLEEDMNDVMKLKVNYFKKIKRLLYVGSRYYYSKIKGKILFIMYGKKNNKYIISEKLQSLNDINDLFLSLRLKYPDIIYIHQDEKYITWRILNNPNITYKMILVYEKDLLKGYCYYNAKNNKIVYITDILFVDFEIGVLLLKKLFKICDENEIAYVYYMGNIKNTLNKNIFDLLNRVGFNKYKNKMSFVLKNLTNTNESTLFNIENWYLSGLWTEGYREY